MAGELTILDPRMQEAGIAFGKGVLRNEDQEWNIYLAICDVAVPAPAEPRGRRFFLDFADVTC